jgi:hypothetical protein
LLPFSRYRNICAIVHVLQPQSLTIDCQTKVKVVPRDLVLIRSPVFVIMDSGLYFCYDFITFHGADNKPATQLLNETKVIFETALFSIVLLVLGLGVINDG